MNTATETATDKILSKKVGSVGHLIINNPEKRNAISLDMSIAAADVMDDFLADDAIRVIVLSGAGGKSFAAGADISKFEKSRATKEDVANYNKTGERFRLLLPQLQRCPRLLRVNSVRSRPRQVPSKRNT